MRRLGCVCGRRLGTGSRVSVRQTTNLVVRGLGRAFLCLSVCLSKPNLSCTTFAWWYYPLYLKVLPPLTTTNLHCCTICAAQLFAGGRNKRKWGFAVRPSRSAWFCYATCRSRPCTRSTSSLPRYRPRRRRRRCCLRRRLAPLAHRKRPRTAISRAHSLPSVLAAAGTARLFTSTPWDAHDGAHPSLTAMATRQACAGLELRSPTPAHQRWYALDCRSFSSRVGSWW